MRHLKTLGRSIKLRLLLGKIRYGKKKSEKVDLADVTTLRDSLESDASVLRSKLMKYEEPPGRSMVISGVPVRGHLHARGDSVRVMIYMPGGSFVRGSRTTHSHLAEEIAKRHSMDVYSVDYKKSPEHAYPAACEDLEKVSKWVESNYPGATVYWAGDSAGATVILNSLLRIQQGSSYTRKMPDGVIASCPFVDFSLSGDSIVSNRQDDPMLTKEVLETLTPLYLQGLNTRDGKVNALYSQFRKKQLPALSIITSPDDLIYSDSIRLAQKLSPLTNVQLIEKSGFHAFTWFYPWLPEATSAIDEAITFIVSHSTNIDKKAG